MKNIERVVIIFLIILLIGSSCGLGYLYYGSIVTIDAMSIDHVTKIKEIEDLKAQIIENEDRIKEYKAQTIENEGKITELKNTINVQLIEMDKKDVEIIRMNTVVSLVLKKVLRLLQILLRICFTNYNRVE